MNVKLVAISLGGWIFQDTLAPFQLVVQHQNNNYGGLNNNPNVHTIMVALNLLQCKE